MRLDLVCTDIFGSIANLQLLMFINNIDNPFGIRENDIIFYVDGNDLSKANTLDPKILQDNRDNLINAFKASVSDPARSVYLQNRGTDQLPPNILPSDAPKILIDNQKVVVGANLFSNPNNQVRNSNSLNSTSSLGTLTDSSGNPVPTTTPSTLTQEELSGDQTTKVLVATFIQSGDNTTQVSTTTGK